LIRFPQVASRSIPSFVDQAVRIAHSKIIIIDAKEIITGSFNFTNAAEHYNSENLLILKNYPGLAESSVMPPSTWFAVRFASALSAKFRWTRRPPRPRKSECGARHIQERGKNQV
jgi:phosphatidylserine/phosphatidylglycerophosphate/cardiolipin synthase-like enzyme